MPASCSKVTAYNSQKYYTGLSFYPYLIWDGGYVPTSRLFTPVTKIH